MKSDNRPTFGALLLYYLIAVGMFLIFGPSAYFYLTKNTVKGEIVLLDSATAQIRYFDHSGEEYLVTKDRNHNSKNLKISDKVEVYYRGEKPTNVYLPHFDGYEPYLLYYIFLLMALVAVYIMHRRYLIT